MTVVSLANQKGGIGKTTSAGAIGEVLSRKGKKVALVDLDPQGNLTAWNGIDLSNDDYTSRELLLGECSFKQAVKSGTYYDIVPADQYLEHAPSELKASRALFALRNALKEARNDYDFIIIDCPPNMGMLTTNALVASDEVLIPMTSSKFSEAGLDEIQSSIQDIKENSNPSLSVAGVFFNRLDSRNNLSKKKIGEIKELSAKYNMPFFERTIRRTVRVDEAQDDLKALSDYEKAETVMGDFEELVREYLSGK